MGKISPKLQNYCLSHVLKKTIKLTLSQFIADIYKYNFNAFSL